MQMLINHYFQPKRKRGGPPKTSFLDLPKDIRRRIYRKAGLVSKDTIYLNYIPKENSCLQDYNPDSPETWPDDEDSCTVRSRSLSHFLDGYLPHPKIQLERLCPCSQWLCRCSAFTYQLLYVSKYIAEEASAIFFSENHFTVFQNRIGGLSVLEYLPRKILAQITSLSIYLNIVEDFDSQLRILGIDDFPKCHAVCTASNKDRLFRKESAWSDQVIAMKEWQRLWKVLKPNINQSRLKLYISCDVQDVEVVDEFLRPLLSTPRLQLRQCSIRLGTGTFAHEKFRDYNLRTLQQLSTIARRATENLTTTQPTSPFRYGDLPKEIRLQILENSDLVAPYDLAWSPTRGESPEYQQHRSKFFENRRLKRNQVSACCKTCSPVNDGVCSCFFRRGAFSTTCTCWNMPQYLLVNRMMREDSEQVFYEKNHFVIVARARNETKLRIHDFLTQLSDIGLRYIRSIFVYGYDIHPWPDSRPEDDSTDSRPTELLQWEKCMSIISHKMNAGQLRFIIDLSFEKQIVAVLLGSDVRHVGDDEYTAEAEKVWRLGKVLVDPFLKQKRVKDLFVHFTWPFADHVEGISQDRGRLLEQMVMGDEYDGLARGRNERRHLWNGYQCGDWYDTTCSACWAANRS